MAFNNIKRGSLALLLVFIYQTSVKGINTKRVEVNFYGHTVKIDYDNKLNNIRYESAVEQFIKSFDEKSTGSDYVSLVNQFHQASQNFGLDDVGKILLVNAFTKKAFAHRPQNFKTLIAWYILYRDSMDVMLCYTKRKFSLYGRLNITPYGIGYINKRGKIYTDLSFSTQKPQKGRVTEYRPKNYNSQPKRLIQLNTKTYPKIDAIKKRKVFSFIYNEKQYHYNATINQSLIQYLRDLPVIELGNSYVSIGFSKSLKESLINGLGNTIKSMEKRDAMAFLLKFVQSIPYKTDDEQWGYERYSFGEETLFNDYADCEDKVILYATLLKELLSVECVALVYEKDEHVAIALKLPQNSANFSFTYGGEKYLTAEPTGQGFELGRLGFDVKRVDNVVDLH